MALRWKKEPRETGLRAVCARPRSSYLRDANGARYASVSALARSGSQWYWVAGWDSGIPYKNTCNEPAASEQEAKQQAMAYVKAAIRRCTHDHP